MTRQPRDRSPGPMPALPGQVWLRTVFDAVLIGGALALDWNSWLRYEAGTPAGWWSMYFLEFSVLAVLFMRWRRPLAVFAVEAGYAVLLAQILPGADFVGGLLIGLHTVARQHRPRISVPTAMCCVALILIGGYRSVWDQFYYANGSFPALTFASALYAIAPVTVWLLGYWSRRATLARAAAEAVKQARRGERLQLARELHDIVSHSVAVMMLQAAGARAIFAQDPDRVLDALDTIQAAGTASMAELNRMLNLMRMPDDAIPTPGGTRQGLEGLDDLVDRMRATGLAVTVESTGHPAQLDASVNLTAYRVVQEALTNSTKHAGPDATAQVTLAWASDRLTVTVADKGFGRTHDRGGPVPSTGHGLIGLQERVQAVGGDFRAEAYAHGFVVTAALPLSASEAPLPAHPAPTG
ncbi:hypothetical protein GCM10010168_42180 [Actinoplanes ianthinogenes]|uniref:histidine kinase n=1 Tax=Actinoplanes ianthinogenes TaxID=122358 RepID=A0ABN6CDA2_9ACTN|nr:histidine kinase [Actinoplanes ianthinogenes]BCJ43472.1 hypothetical protein Aiant_41290 [Actinoplanes ianthinogenes]GGR19868.1 hypothetical protein GCM10010168_42180 [Actinoplanes ianthinogenes]